MSSATLKGNKEWILATSRLLWPKQLSYSLENYERLEYAVKAHNFPHAHVTMGPS